MTFGVYGFVAGIVKLDDLGLHLSARPGQDVWAQTRRSLGSGLVHAAPWLMKVLAVLGTAAMFLVGGGILALAYGTFGIGGLLLTFLPVGATGYAFRLYADNIRQYVAELETANQDLDKVNRDLLKTLGSIIDADDKYTYGHSNQVTAYAQAIGQRMGLPQDQLEILTRGGLVHDLGKVGVPDTIVSKPDRLTDEEFALMKRHTVIGAEIVSQMQGLQELTPLVRHHHERWDGRGYPDGLKGEEIPLLARVLCVADSVEAMLSDRPYRAALSLEEVMAEVNRCAGVQFDPQIAAYFLALAKEEGEQIFTNNAGSPRQAAQHGPLLHHWIHCHRGND
jgi:putative nucleotidyltransferase with HDIG domain